LTATCSFISHSDFTAVNLGKVKDGAKSTVKSTADYANKFSAGCYLAAVPVLADPSATLKTVYTYFGAGFTTVKASGATAGDSMLAGQGVINVYSKAKVDAVTTPTTTCLSGTLTKGADNNDDTKSPFSAALSNFGDHVCKGFMGATAASNFLFAGFKGVPAATSALLKESVGKT
jgi:hypothetical protein